MNACSNKSSESEVTSALPLMVIEQSDFQRDYLKPCKHTSQCSAPLICKDKVCKIPPSIIGKSDENTKTLKYTTSEGEKSIYIEVVSDNYTTQRGMMMRRICHPEWGMLFVFPSATRHAF